MHPNNKPRIAIVEDDRDLMQSYQDYLQAAGYKVWGVASAEAFYKQVVLSPVDVLILDVNLPGEDGISVAEHLRAAPQLAVIIVSARNTLDDRLRGLKAGADRYLVKPIDFAELVATIETIGRRPLAAPVSWSHENTQSLAPAIWHLRKKDWQLLDPNGKLIALSQYELALLNLLFEASGEVVSKKLIAAKIIGSRVLNSSERLDVMLHRLRAKSMQAFGQAIPIKTVLNVGYAFTEALVID
jgi:DNA-binding response OmpR family regulator